MAQVARRLQVLVHDASLGCFQSSSLSISKSWPLSLSPAAHDSVEWDANRLLYFAARSKLLSSAIVSRVPVFCCSFKKFKLAAAQSWASVEGKPVGRWLTKSIQKSGLPQQRANIAANIAELSSVTLLQYKPRHLTAFFYKAEELSQRYEGKDNPDSPFRPNFEDRVLQRSPLVSLNQTDRMIEWRRQVQRHLESLPNLATELGPLAATVRGIKLTVAFRGVDTVETALKMCDTGFVSLSLTDPGHSSRGALLWVFVCSGL